jgi:hypothetical protein
MAKKPAAKPIGDKTADQILASANKAKGAALTPKHHAASPVTVETKALVFTIKPDAPAKDIEKLIISIKGRGAKLDTDIHSAAVACLFHCEAHGDNTLVNRLLLAMPKSVRRNALAQWFVAFGKLSKWPTDTAEQKRVAAEKEPTQPLMYDKAKTTRLDDAKATPFWDFKNVREGTDTFEFEDYIGNVMKKLEKIAKGNSTDAARARATLHAISGVKEALAVQPDASTLEPGQPIPQRRASDFAAPATVQ